MINKKLNFKIFFLSTLFCGLFTIITFFTAFARDEGTIGNNVAIMILAKLFMIFRFPTHVIFGNFISNSSSIIFYLGLFINTMIYGLLIERVLTLIKRKEE